MAVWAIHNGLDCQKCNDQLKSVRGCQGLKNGKTIMGYEVERCPLKSMGPVQQTYLRAYSYYKIGIFPNEGGWLNQPVKFGSMMDVIENCVEQLESKRKKHG